ncbi:MULTISPECIES: 23S rRNA (uracil(1939)-C(5))-methyltransferase RlmD [unclassified Mycoplasma]|uniref:23S rRNA (uracil(1939)-C(5))-methyltransferase RlmD n=1 Tax=unclassified Mycoplasma TaxID=2683645 RepID=UPI00211CCD4B|nr:MULTISPECIES: 23S rRNA (uracil(1939)-C(5))-methyltransferase RlmD [unclassified Mycoplasma]UUM19770.1 23S rRNA (uracil(1939)-C(5))-methyltransferase RlmD [Mycoplasma sp. 1578d]UUM24753.1 23S rRNA (uracil(1939)-C(5))-methyltransferase RlmD [Mycoplasma sp. 3686d]
MSAEIKFQVKCIELSYQGYGVVLYNQKRIFVPDLFPNEQAIIKIEKLHSNYGYGVVETLIKRSIHRNKNQISTNSASLINLQYHAQLKWKDQYLRNLLVKNLNINSQVIQDIVPSNLPFNYRNKVRYALKAHNQKVFYAEYINKSNTLVQVSDFSLNLKSLNYILMYVLEKINFVFQSKINKLKLIDEIMFRVNENNQAQILFSLHSDYDLPIKLINLLKENSFIIDLCVKKKNKIFTIFNKQDFTMNLLDKKFTLKSVNFFQVNLSVFEKILNTIKAKIVNQQDADILIDAYCGVGVFSQILSSHYQQLIGIEINPSSIERAKQNALLNKVNNAHYYAGKVESVIEQKPISANNSTLIIDPPRLGLDIKVIEWISKQNLSNVIYLSCDPRTLTRDLKEFIKNQYKIEQIIPFDMFPNTHHIETLVFLTKSE